jgi:hypothetical protein
MHSANGQIESRIELNAGSMPGETREDGGRLADLGERAQDFAGHMRDSARGGLQSAATMIEETAVVGAIKNNPLTALGVAFIGGLAIAITRQPTTRYWMLDRARRQLRTAIISGVSAVVVQELRTLLGGENGLGDLVESLLDRGRDELDL